ncbi:MAG: hypothetical protein HY561_06030, partial [Gemmatimonadetes bacterium]|nr:hypothetical protein [Gemmatimonadota bacterium]
NDAIAAQVRERLGAAGANADFGQLLQELGPRLGEGRRNIQTALREAQKILTSQQWKKVPDPVKNPFRRFGGGGGGGS